MMTYNNIFLHVHMNIGMCLWMYTCIHGTISIKSLKKEQFIPLVPVAAMEISVGLTQ